MATTLRGSNNFTKGRAAMLTALSPAKLNLVLEVLRKRDDGYHEIRSLAQTINFYDKLTFNVASTISLECSESALNTMDNLVIRAAELLKKSSNYRGGARITLHKMIPSSAGLGGGSSNAATTLLTLNKLWDLELPAPDLLLLAAQLGSDVPFFIHKGTALIEGKGEKVTPLPPSGSAKYFVLLMPPLTPIMDKTKKAYMQLNKQYYTDGKLTARAVELWTESRKLDPAQMFNIFDSIAFDIFPALHVYWRRFEQAGATNIHLAGSGPTLFTLATDKNSATSLHQRISSQGITSYLVTSTID
jgi:4-diphosphocytidyl-2-C-methyl-D-erythritol kinase